MKASQLMKAGQLLKAVIFLSGTICQMPKLHFDGSL
jgi:hypothetical protein